MKIALVTDSSSDIPSELAKKYDIEVIPMYIGYDGDLRKDGVDICPEEVYASLKANKKVHTSSPSAGDFLKVFHFLLVEKNIDFVCCITLSSRLSGAFNAANVARKTFGDGRIIVFDSKTSTICLGFIVLGAAQAASRGSSLEDIERIINSLVVKNRFFALLENFEYVFKGGRVNFFGKIINKALRFIPILTIGKNGKVHLSRFAKNKNSALEEIYKMAVKASGFNSSSKFGIFYGEDINTAKYLEKKLKENKDIKIDEIIITKITTVISAHTGPGIYGIAVSPGFLRLPKD